MIKRDSDAAAVRVPPPLVYLAALVGGWVTHDSLVPLDLSLPLPVRITVAILTAGVGLTLVAFAFRAFRKTGQDPKPWTTTPEFIATGAFRWTRNPMYVGMALILIGLAFGLSNGWLIVAVPIVLAIVQVTAVRHEEVYLERKFGESYATYKRSVRRWV